MSETEELESTLRARLAKNPRSCMLNAQLSIILSNKSLGMDDENMREALSLAKQAVNLAPSRPVGHLALSQCLSQHEDRMASLQKAVDAWHPKGAMTESALAHALIRLLLDPRREEKIQLSKCGRMISNSSPDHPSRRDLNAKESNLYQKILSALDNVWSEETDQTKIDILIWLVQAEYRLGMFFRKLFLTEKHRPRCAYHLARAEQKLPTNHHLKTTYQFWLATVNSHDTSKPIKRCPERHIVSLYSTFAENFDDQLVNKLEYQTPRKLRELVESIAEDNVIWKRAADLGCGTGLSGSAFRNRVKDLIGVDLSPAMIAKAEEKQCYDQLHVGELSTILVNEDEFDFLFSCDVFVYIGDLFEVFKNTKHSLKKGGLFAFSTEFLEEGSAGTCDYSVQSCARFAHKQSYIELLAEKVGFAILKLEKCHIRKNAGKYVTGMLVVMKCLP
mmetsp:Transcript_692/g.1090  ORF Transcript_692/g.1090 Transcript_692/m.1090 type:complete len:447 (+) Transcript_692:84-1424(+)